MKKYVLHIFLLILSAAAFVFVYYSASSGTLLFEDGREGELAARLQSVVTSIGDEAQGIVFGLRALAEDSSVHDALKKDRCAKDQERGLLALKSLAENWHHCLWLRLLDGNNRVIIDTRSHVQAGALLDEKEQARLRDLLKKPGNFEIFTGGQSDVAVRSVSNTAVLQASFSPSFIKPYFERELDDSLQMNVSDGAVLAASRGVIPVGERLKALVSDLRTESDSATRREANTVYASAKADFTSQFLVLAENYDGRELPVLAVQLLILTGLIFLALLLLLILRIFHYGDAARMASVNKRLAINDELTQESQATVEEIVQATDKLTRQPEYSVLDEGSARAADEEMPTLQSVLKRSQFDEDARVPNREHDAELERVIHVVADKNDSFEEERDAGVFDEYWRSILATLEQKFSITDVLLLEDDGAGVFRVQYSSGFGGCSFDACSIDRAEKLYKGILAKRKILYIREGALKNTTIKSRFPDLLASSVDQMVFLPVIREKEISALLIIAQPPGSPLLVQESLQEIHRLSIL